MMDVTPPTDDHLWYMEHQDAAIAKHLADAVSVCSFRDGAVSLNAAYQLYPDSPDSTDSTDTRSSSSSKSKNMSDSPLARYTTALDADRNTLFQLGLVLPQRWVRTLVDTVRTDPDHPGWNLLVGMRVAPLPDCIYKISVFMFSNGLWDVVQDPDFVWEPGSLRLRLDSARFGAACALHASGSGGATPHQFPIFVLGFTRVDMGQLPAEHTFTLDTLQLQKVDAAADALETTRSRSSNPVAAAAACRPAQVLASIRDSHQLRQPFAILTKDRFAGVCQPGQSHAILQFSVQGRCQNVRSLVVRFQPVVFASHSTSTTETCPTVYTACVDDGGGSFACSVNHLFCIDVDSIEVTFSLPGSSTTADDFRLEITHLKLVPTPIQTQITRLYHENETESVGFHTIDHIQKDVRELREIAAVIQKKPGPEGPVGKRGVKGERGEPMRFEELDAPQKEELRGKRGVPGPRGKPMVFEDLTEAQQAMLEGTPGKKGDRGKAGDTGHAGPRGEALVFGELSETQREMLRGERGVQGFRGDALTFEELTDAQKRVLLGDKGDRGHKGDTGEHGERGRVGSTGPNGAEGKQGPRGLPGVPGAKGDRGELGESGTNGAHGHPAVIKSSFLSVDLLEDYVRKSPHLIPNTYYIIDHPNDEHDHGKLFAYTGELDIELVVCCSYVENIQAVLEEYHAVIRTTVQTDHDEWKMTLTVHSADIGVYHIRRGLENSITQSGYLVKSSVITEDALQPVGKLCGVHGSKGDAGERGAAGRSMLGLRLDFIGSEATRLKLHQPEPNSIFLQVQASKNHEAGFYLYEEANSAWKLLHGVDVSSSFLQWMAQYVDNPHQESIPLVLSMFATTQKQMEGHYNNVRHDLQEYRNTNEKWKKYQFEHWKSMGNSQYQQFNTQLSEHGNLMESVVQQVNGLSEKATTKDELGLLRKLMEKQHEKLSRQYTSARDALSEYTERQTVDKSVFEHDQESVQSKLRDLDMSTLKMLKIVQYLKNAPWSKAIKDVRHEIGQHALVQADFYTQQEKQNKDVRHHIDHDFPEATKHQQSDMHQLVDRVSAGALAVERQFAEWGDQYDRRLLAQSAEHADAVAQLQKKLHVTLEQSKIELVASTAKRQYTLKQETLDKHNEICELFFVHEQDTKKMHHTMTKRVETVDAKTEAALKKHALVFETTLTHTAAELQAAFDKRLDHVATESGAKLLQTAGVLHQERTDSDTKHAAAFRDWDTRLTEAAAGATAMDERWAAAFDDQSQTAAAALTKQVERCRADMAKQVRDTDAQAQDKLLAMQAELKQQHTQHTYDAKGAAKRMADGEARVHDDVERKLSTAKTHTDERCREIDQKFSNAIQSLTSDAQGVDARCSAVDYTLKARMESVEEHIQQLFAEGQQQCETLVDKNKKDSHSALETLREDLVGQHQQLHLALSGQQKRADANVADKLQLQADHLHRVDAAVLEAKRCRETLQQGLNQQAHTQLQLSDTLRKDVQHNVLEMCTQLKHEQDALQKQLHDTKRELLSVIEHHQSEHRTASEQKHTDLHAHVTRAHTDQTDHVTKQLHQIRQIVQGLCGHVDSFAKEEAGHRQQHEHKLQQVVLLLEKTFADMTAEQ
jgi:hypothetical protein